MVRMMMLAGAKSPLHHTIQAGHSTAKASAPHFRDVRGLVNEFMVCLQMVGLPGIMDVASLPHRETRHAGTAHSYPNRARDRSRAFSASTSRSRGGELVCSDASKRRALSETSETARLNASALACDGELKPDSFRTNCSAEAWISAWVAGGSKLNRVLMLRHMVFSSAPVVGQGRTAGAKSDSMAYSVTDHAARSPLSAPANSEFPMTHVTYKIVE